MILAITAFLLLPGTGCHGPSTRKAPDGPEWRAPLLRDTDGNLTMTVSARSGDHQFYLHVDTGASTTTITRSLANELGLELLPSSEHTVAGISGNDHPAWDAVLPSLRVGDVDLGHVAVTVVDLPDWEQLVASRSPFPVRGLVGLDLLRRTGAIVDCAEGTVFFRNPRGPALVLTGRVVAGEPGATSSIGIERGEDEQPPVPGDSVEVLLGDQQLARSVADAEGRFEIAVPTLTGGERLEVDAPGCAGFTLGTDPLPSGRDLPALRITLAPVTDCDVPPSR